MIYFSFGIVFFIWRPLLGVYGGDSSYFRMLPEMSRETGTIVVYQKHGSSLELKNFLDMKNKRINLPFKIDDCFWAGPKSLLITSSGDDEKSKSLKWFNKNAFFSIKIDGFSLKNVCFGIRHGWSEIAISFLSEWFFNWYERNFFNKH